MIPIYEQGKGDGIGHSFESFVKRFIDICNEHVANKRAKAFAFLLYDFNDSQVRKILKSQGGFARLDRLSGSNLSLFYLHSNDKHLLKLFNKVFLTAFGIDQENTSLPMVIFFKISDNEVSDLSIVELEQSNMMFAFNELYDIIQNYIDRLTNDKISVFKPKVNKAKQFLKSAKQIALEKFAEWLITKGAEAGRNFLHNN